MGSTFAFAAADIEEHNHDGEEILVIENLNDDEEAIEEEEVPAIETENEGTAEDVITEADADEVEEEVNAVELAVLSLEEGAPGYKVLVEVSSELADGTVTTVTGAVYDDYSAKLDLPDASVNAGNVTVGVTMKNIASMGITGEKHHEMTLTTGATSGSNAALRAALGNLYDFKGATVNATISANGKDAAVVYAFEGVADEKGTVITATPSSTEAAREAWQLMMKDNFEFVTDKEADSYIVIANGSSMQIGNEKLVFEEEVKDDIKLDNFAGGFGDMNTQIREMVKLETVEESAVTFTLKEGTELAVDQSSAKLTKDVTVTVDVDAAELNAGNILSTLRDAKSVDELLLTLVGTLNTVVGAIDGKTVDVTIEFTCTHVEDEGTVTTEPTCTTTGVRTFACTKCGEVLRTETISRAAHTITRIERVEPTCTTAGKTDGRFCSVCGMVTVPTRPIAALGHDIVIDEAVEATCTETGLTAGSHCSRCDDMTVEQEVIPMADHTPVVDEAVAATCTATGLTEGSHCSVCNEVIAAQEETPMIAHTPVSANNRVEATYDAPGKEADTICSECGTLITEGAVIEQLTRRPSGGGGSSRPSTPTVIEDPDVPLASALPFDDVKEKDWFHEAVQFVYDNDLMTGATNTAFAPYADTTRGMIVTILYRLEGSPEVTAPAAFTDVAAGKYYANAVAWAAANEIVTGYSETTFAPEKNISRQEMAAILYRYANFKKYDVTGKAELTAYTDASAVHGYAVEPMQWSVSNKLIEGETSSTLAPTNGANRAQVATILMRFVNNFVNTETETE